MKPSSDLWDSYFIEHALKAPFTPYDFDGEDRNLLAFRSQSDFISWYGQPPGTPGGCYRDELFYVRELTIISQEIKPRTIVEFGTALGIGTYLLSILNPNALLVTVDNRRTQFMPGDVTVPTGVLAKHQKIPVQYELADSTAFQFTGIDLTFIDADHAYEMVLLDSERAWANRSCDHAWAIAWHDYVPRERGVVDAVNEFCQDHGLKLITRPDSGTVWVRGEADAD